jgi:hypothetical protein
MALRREIRITAQYARPTRCRLGPAKIYLDDVQLIYESLAKAAIKRAKDSNVTEPAQIFIGAGEAYAESPDDLRDAKPEELQKVSIGIEHPAIVVDLHRRFASISAYSDVEDYDGEEVANRIRNYINSRRSFRAAFLCWRPTELRRLVLGWFSFFILGTLFGALTKPRLWFFGLIVATVVAITMAGLVTYTIYRLGAIRIIPHNESEIRGLSSETRKQLMIALIGAIVGALILGLAGLWAGVYAHH